MVIIDGIEIKWVICIATNQAKILFNPKHQKLTNYTVKCVFSVAWLLSHTSTQLLMKIFSRVLMLSLIHI